jgi:hypothetical protein
MKEACFLIHNLKKTAKIHHVSSLRMHHSYIWIQNREIWAGFLEAGNAGVHDYFGLSSEEYAGIARNFYAAAVECVRTIQRKLLSEDI